MRAFWMVCVLPLVGLCIRAQEIQLKGPATVPAGSPFEVTWLGGPDKGPIITVANPDGSRLVGAAYGYVSTKGKVKLEAPVKAGAYLLLYKQGNTVLAQRSLQVTAVTASLSVPQSLTMRQTFEVQWSGPAYRTTRVQAYNEKGVKVSGCGAYVANARGKPIKLVAPEQPGTYELRSEVLARATFTVKGVDASLETPSKGVAGGEILVRFSGPNNRGDRLCLATAGATKPLTGTDYAYTQNGTDGSVRLDLPERSGRFEVVYLSGSTVLARAPIDVVEVAVALEAATSVQAQMSFECRWQGPGNQGDRITVYDLKKKADSRAYTYIDPLNPAVVIRAPDQEGRYELQYRTRAGRVLAKRPLIVTPAPARPATLRVLPPVAVLGSQDGVAVILDASGSMLQRQNGKRRIEIARDTLTALLRETLPEGIGFALRAFGHLESGSCRSDLVLPLAPLKREKAIAEVSGIQAQNRAKTPIAKSLAQVGADLKQVKGQRVVLLVTDGEETCDGDPALAIAALRNRGWDLRVNIVGYAIDQEELRQTFENWAALGGGRYFNATDEQELGKALKQAVAPRFTVVDDQGQVVAEGVAGGPSFRLPAGAYEVRSVAAGKPVKKRFTLAADQALDLQL